MHPTIWMEDLFGSRARVRVLRLLARDPARSWSERELAKAVGMSPNTVNLAIRALRDQGVLQTRTVGRTHLVGLRKDLRVAAFLHQAFRVEQAAWDETVAAMRRAVPADSACYLFGSSAAGVPTPASDIDVLVVSPTRGRAEEVAADVRRAGLRVLPCRIQIVALSLAESRSARHRRLVGAAHRAGVRLSKRALEALP